MITATAEAKKKKITATPELKESDFFYGFLVLSGLSKYSSCKVGRKDLATPHSQT